MARKLPHGLKPGFFGRCIDDVFVLFSSMDQAEKFKKYLSSTNPNINFSFLDINIYCEKGKFVANVCQKKILSGVYSNFNSFIPETYKISLVKSLLLRCFNLIL